MTKIIVDGIEVDVPAEYTLMQACEAAGVEIPRFCYHERLSIAGNCRMCLVEVKGAPKPVSSCTWGVKDCRPGPNGEPPEVLTRSPTVKKAREGVMEFILINHPLDCPICDQGGQCDLQDQAMAYGVDNSRFQEDKHAVADKYIGPLVKTSMNRCIQCTRCVRFSAEIAGVPEMGALWRGEDTEITTYLEQAMTSELQANVADLCPVGALTHRPGAFSFRPWELTHTDSIDVMDAVGSAIRVDTRGRDVMRIQPRLNEDINEEWISDKTRHVVDGLRSQRLDRPYVKENGKLRPASWSEAFEHIAEKIKGAKKVGAIIGALPAVEEIFALKSLMKSLGSKHFDCRQNGSVLTPALGRASYVLNSGIAGIEDADAILIVGSNPRLEASLVNVRIRKRWSQSRLPIGVIGEKSDLTYDYTYLGAGPETLAGLTDGSAAFAKVLTEAKKPLILVGQGAISRKDGLAVLALAAQVADKVGAISENWQGFGIIHTDAAQVGALDLGFVPDEGGLTAIEMAKANAVDVLYNLGADELDIEPGAFVIYQGSHGDRGAHRADVILPGAAYTEKSGTYVNTEGRVQMALRAGFPPGDAREDWAIIRALSEVLGHRLPFDNLESLRRNLYGAYPMMAALDDVAKSDLAHALQAITQTGSKMKVSSEAFASPIKDFYFTNPIARASGIMAECSSVRNQVLQAAE